MIMVALLFTKFCTPLLLLVLFMGVLSVRGIQVYWKMYIYIYISRKVFKIRQVGKFLEITESIETLKVHGEEGTSTYCQKSLTCIGNSVLYNVNTWRIIFTTSSYSLC